MTSFKNGKYLVLVLTLVLAFSLTGCKSNDSKVVASIDGVNITEGELHDMLIEKYGDETLNFLISEKIVDLEIDKEKIEISPEEIDKELKSMEDQYGGKEALSNAMTGANLTEKSLKEEIRKNLSLKKLLASDLTVSDEEISDYYEKNKEQFTQKEEVDASHILVESKDLAKDIKKKLDAGEDFAKLAQKHSTDEGTKENGGNLGFFGRGEMVESFDEVAFNLDKGKISDPVKSEYGYHIILVNEKKKEKVRSLEDSKDDIREILLQSKMPEAFNKWYGEKVTKYEITNNLNKDKTQK